VGPDRLNHTTTRSTFDALSVFAAFFVAALDFRLAIPPSFASTDLGIGISFDETGAGTTGAIELN
jgi:hypothetical protein